MKVKRDEKWIFDYFFLRFCVRLFLRVYVYYRMYRKQGRKLTSKGIIKNYYTSPHFHFSPFPHPREFIRVSSLRTYELRERIPESGEMRCKFLVCRIESPEIRDFFASVSLPFAGLAGWDLVVLSPPRWCMYSYWMFWFLSGCIVRRKNMVYFLYNAIGIGNIPVVVVNRFRAR